MTTPTSLHDRLNDKAKAGVQFAAITSTDVTGRAKTVLVPGSEGKQYEVIIRRYIENGSPVITTECNCKTGIGIVPCKGNSSGHCCYHSLIALLKSVENTPSHIHLSFCADEKRAANLKNLGGIVIKVKSHQGHGELYAVAK